MFSDLIEKLRARRDLTEAEASAAMTEIMAGRATPAQIAGLLIGLSMKGERTAEIVPLPRSHDAVFDTCGTGGDKQHTFNVSSLAAIVMAACDVRVAKHGNRSVSSRCGSADLFEGLGVNVAASPETVDRCLRDVGIAFLFAPTFHPSMRHAGPTRRELGVRTVFNLLGPLTNPAGATRQVIGVPRSDYTGLIARALGALGSERAWVVHGANGLDEISIEGYTKVSEWHQGHVHTFFLHPSDFGLEAGPLDPARVDGLDESLTIAQSVLSGADGLPRRFVLMNAAAGLFVAGRTKSLKEGVAVAAAVLDDGLAQAKTRELVDSSQEAPA